MTESPSNSIAAESQKSKRPFGVWFLTVYMGLFAGVFPIGAALFLLLNQPTLAEGGLTSVDLIFPFFQVYLLS